MIEKIILVSIAAILLDKEMSTRNKILTCSILIVAQTIISLVLGSFLLDSLLQIL